GRVHADSGQAVGGCSPGCRGSANRRSEPDETLGEGGRSEDEDSAECTHAKPPQTEYQRAKVKQGDIAFIQLLRLSGLAPRGPLVGRLAFHQVGYAAAGRIECLGEDFFVVSAALGGNVKRVVRMLESGERRPFTEFADDGTEEFEIGQVVSRAL